MHDGLDVWARLEAGQVHGELGGGATTATEHLPLEVHDDKIVGQEPLMAACFGAEHEVVKDAHGEVAIEADAVCVRSASRVGDSDFDVNAKRINFIATALKAKGWQAAGVAL